MSRSIKRQLAWLVPLWLALGGLPGCQSPGRPVPTPASPVPTPASGIVGQVVDSGGDPVPGAYVYAYRNPDSALRGPADFEAKVDAGGHYFLDLVEGKYYLVARWRRSGADMGPPRPGDAWALPGNNPVRVKAEEPIRVDFVLQGVVDPRLMREGTLTGGDTGFSGRLVGPDRQPVAGAFVVAYPEANFKGMPAATSAAVAEDGRFILFVDRPGEWCLAARSRTRGQPVAGELYGRLGPGSAACRTLPNGQILDVGTISLAPYSP